MAIVLALGLSYVLARALAHPLENVATRARRIAAGAVDMQPLPSSRMTELADLVEAFNRLTSDLDERIRELAGERDEVRDVLNAINEGVVALTADARLVRVNDAALQILDVKSIPPLTHVSRFVRSAELRVLMEAAPSYAVGAREVHLGDKRYLVSGRPLGVGGAVVTFVDVSEIRRLEEVRSDFVANASHELKTPLTAVRGFSETLLEDDPPEELRQSFLDLIWRNTVRLQQLVEDLLDLSRLESGGVGGSARARPGGGAGAQGVGATRATGRRVGRAVVHRGWRHRAGGRARALPDLPEPLRQRAPPHSGRGIDPCGGRVGGWMSRGWMRHASRCR